MTFRITLVVSTEYRESIVDVSEAIRKLIRRENSEIDFVIYFVKVEKGIME